MSSIYTGLADFGQVYSLLGFIFGCIVALVLIIIGLVIVLKKDPPVQPGVTPQKVARYIGWILIITGIIIVVITWLIWHLTRKSKAFAAVEGGLGVIQGVKSIFSPSDYSEPRGQFYPQM